MSSLAVTFVEKKTEQVEIMRKIIEISEKIAKMDNLKILKMYVAPIYCWFACRCNVVTE